MINKLEEVLFYLQLVACLYLVMAVVMVGMVGMVGMWSNHKCFVFVNIESLS